MIEKDILIPKDFKCANKTLGDADGIGEYLKYKFEEIPLEPESEAAEDDFLDTIISACIVFDNFELFKNLYHENISNYHIRETSSMKYLQYVFNKERGESSASHWLTYSVRDVNIPFIEYILSVIEENNWKAEIDINSLFGLCFSEDPEMEKLRERVAKFLTYP